MLNEKLVMFALATLSCFAAGARGQTTWSDDFEDGVINSSLWEQGGAARGAGGSSWEFSHEEIVAADGYLKMRVWGPESGNSFSGEAWLQTQYDYNDGSSYIINFMWEADVNATHIDMYAIQITDGTAPPPGDDIFWFGECNNPTDGPTWVNVYHECVEGDMSPPENWSICINGASDTAMVFDGSNCTGRLKGQNTLPSGQAWHVRLILLDDTSAGFPEGDNLLNVYDFCSHCTTEGPAAIPTVSEWGMVAMTLLVLTAGTVVYTRRGATERDPSPC